MGGIFVRLRWHSILESAKVAIIQSIGYEPPMSLSTRAELLLKTLIERYIADGQPVGSRILARQAGLELSSATVRNVMADLEDLGLVRSPHTSSGRVPTELGYRMFIDTLLKIKPLEVSEVQKLEHELRAAPPSAKRDGDGQCHRRTDQRPISARSAPNQRITPSCSGGAATPAVHRQNRGGYLSRDPSDVTPLNIVVSKEYNRLILDSSEGASDANTFFEF